MIAWKFFNPVALPLYDFKWRTQIKMMLSLKSIRIRASYLPALLFKPIDDLVNVGKITALPNKDSETTAKLISEIEANEGRTRFSPRIERHYRTATKTARQRFFVMMAIIGVTVYDLFLWPTYLLIPELLPLMSLLQLGVATPIAAILIIAIVRMKIDPDLPCLIILFSLLTTSLICINASRSEDITIYAFTLPLFILGGNIFVAISFAMATLFTAFANISILFVILLHPGIRLDIAIFLIVVIVTASCFSLLANYRIDSGMRSAYLHALIERLRAEQLAFANKHLASLVSVDGLTGLHNRRSFDSEMARLWSSAQISGDVALLMIDIDNFKNLNDTYGHPGGDACLRQVAQLLLTAQENPRALAVRYGGEEFAIIVTDSSLYEAYELAERLRTAIEQTIIVLDEGSLGIHLTVSIGCATIAPSAHISPIDLCSAADAALYKAKQAGKNQTQIASFNQHETSVRADRYPGFDKVG